MSSKLDPRLAMLASESTAQLKQLSKTRRFGIESVGADGDTVARVLLQCTQPDVDRLRTAGMRVTSVSGDIVAGSVPLSSLDSLQSLEEVKFIESSRPVFRELDLAIPEIRADLAHAAPLGLRGAGVVVGIIDSGVDWRHQNFRRPDGTSRVLAIWDQGLSPQAGESSPAPFGYGVEYVQAHLNGALATPPTSAVRHTDGDAVSGHGTHVTGIAAGDGSAPDPSGATFALIGVAPEADIIVVANAVNTEAMGDSANTLDALQYIFNQAGALGRPVVVNMSQGDNLGPHDGTSLLERGIDNLLGGPGRAFIKSAGNEGSLSRHAQGRVLAAAPETVRFNIPPSDTTDETIDLWYPGVDRFSIAVVDPNGNSTAVVAAGTSTTGNLPGGNRVTIDSRVGNPNNGDNQVFIQVRRGTAASLRSGTWSLQITAPTLVNGAFHAWIERANQTPATFLLPHQSNDFTISIPGTSREVITVGSYVTRGAGAGTLSTFSSRGPTRDGRDAPTITAPGQVIHSARANGIAMGLGNYHGLQGTSMAAPMVTGTVALMLQAAPTLTQARITDCLRTHARADASTAAGPATGWGAGKVDAQASVGCRAGLSKPAIDAKRPLDTKRPIFDPKPAVLEPKPTRIDPKIRDPKFLDPKLRDPKFIDPKVSDPKLIDPKRFDPKGTDPFSGLSGVRPFAFATPSSIAATSDANDNVAEHLIALEAEYARRAQAGQLNEADMQVWELVALAAERLRCRS